MVVVFIREKLFKMKIDYLIRVIGTIKHIKYHDYSDTNHYSVIIIQC